MSSLNYCRLCVNIGLDFKSLYDEHGHANEVYELTTKYFDQSILNIDEGKHLTIICMQCWEHIWDFNNFQQAVHVAQSNLDTFKQLEIATPIVKTEENLTPQDLYHNVSTIHRKKDYAYLAETGEVKIEITIDEDVAPSKVDTDDRAKEIRNQPNLIYVDSDSNVSLDEYSKINNPETLSVCKSGNTNVNQDNCGGKDTHNYDYNSSNIAKSCGQLLGNCNQEQEAFNEELNIYTPKSKQSFVCAFCSERCCQYENLREHFNRMHPSKNMQTLCCNLNHIGFKSITHHLFFHYFTCVLCGNESGKLNLLLRHIRDFHPDDGREYEKILQQWSSSSFPCNECGKISSGFRSFRRHISVYHPNRKHKCEICEKSFNAQLALREHMTTHTGEPIYTCPHCPLKFKTRSSLCVHKKRKHLKRSH